MQPPCTQGPRKWPARWPTTPPLPYKSPRRRSGAYKPGWATTISTISSDWLTVATIFAKAWRHSWVSGRRNGRGHEGEHDDANWDHSGRSGTVRCRRRLPEPAAEDRCQGRHDDGGRLQVRAGQHAGPAAGVQAAAGAPLLAADARRACLLRLSRPDGLRVPVCRRPERLRELPQEHVRQAARRRAADDRPGNGDEQLGLGSLGRLAVRLVLLGLGRRAQPIKQ